MNHASLCVLSVCSISHPLPSDYASGGPLVAFVNTCCWPSSFLIAVLSWSSAGGQSMFVGNIRGTRAPNGGSTPYLVAYLMQLGSSSPSARLIPLVSGLIYLGFRLTFMLRLRFWYWLYISDAEERDRTLSESVYIHTEIGKAIFWKGGYYIHYPTSA